MSRYPENGAVGKHLLMLKQRSQRRKMLRKWLLIASGAMLLTLVVLMSGCATHSPTPCDPPTATSKPVPDKSIPSQSYSLNVQEWLEQWRLKLIAGQSKP